MSLARAVFAVLFAVVLTWGWMEHSRRVDDEQVAAELRQAAALAASTVNPAYLQFERVHRRPPSNNIEAGLPPPTDPSWHDYDSVQLYPSGDVRFEFHSFSSRSRMRYAYVWRSSQRVAPGSISCAVRGIPLRVLANLRMRCNVELTEAAADEASSALPPIPKPPPLPADLVLAAVERDDPVELERLRQSGTDLCQVDSMKRIALAEAVRGNQIKTLTALLATNCPIDALEPATGRSPLMIASAAYEMPIAQLLLQHGASPSLADARGENAWFLLGAGAAEAGNPDLQVRATMLAQGVDINARNPHGQTLLMLAASAGAYDLAQWLLAKGANLDAQDEAGRTALMHAVTATSGENALPLLLQHRASTKLTDHQGATAMALAQQIGDPSRHRRVLWLLTGG